MGPQPFLNFFCKLLTEAEIDFALTSGQACVYYGIQQTTKDSDWIIEPNDLVKLVVLLQGLDGHQGYRVSYRAICGAPCSSEYLANGWTTHIQITDSDGAEHHVDLFGAAPRVSQIEKDSEDPNFASRHIVAQMKKTDREKDWPFVFALARQAVSLGDWRGVLHGTDADWLLASWPTVPDELRLELTTLRPLLSMIEAASGKLRRALMIERFVWQAVNRHRYRVFQNAWKEFFRQWRHEAGFDWPSTSGFGEQVGLLQQAAVNYQLPPRPLDELAKRDAVQKARHEAAEIFAADDIELDTIVPPLTWMLP